MAIVARLKGSYPVQVEGVAPIHVTRTNGVDRITLEVSEIDPSDVTVAPENIVGITDDAVDFLTGSAFPVVEAYKRAIIFGDSMTANCSTYSATESSYTAESWFSWMNRLLGQNIYLDPSLNKGTAGNTTTQMRARFSADVLANASSFDIAFILGGYNDITAGTPTGAYTNLTYFAETLAGLGKLVVLITILPENNTAAANRKFYGQINQRLRTWAATASGKIILCDAWGDLADPSTEVPATSPVSLLPDGVHPGVAGAYLLGKRLASLLYPYQRIGPNRAPAAADPYDATANPCGNLLTNPEFTGTGGTLSNGSGSLATSYTLTRAASTWLNAEVVASKQTVTAGFGARPGYRQVIAASIASGKTATETIILVQAPVTLPTTTDYYYAEVTMDLSNIANLKEVSLIVYDNTSTYFCSDGTMKAGAVNGYFHTDALSEVVLRTPKWFPPTAATSLQFVVKFILDASSATASVTARISNPQLRKVV